MDCLERWLGDLSYTLKEKRKSWDCSFNDGPFVLRLEEQQGDLWNLTAMRDSRGFDTSNKPETVFTATVSLKDFAQSLQGAAEQASIAILKEVPYHERASKLVSTIQGVKGTIAGDRQ